MREFWDRVLKALAAAGGAVVGLLGGWTPLLTVLCAFMALDYLTGLAAAARGKSDKTETGGLSSKAGFDGLLRKAVIMLVVLMAALLDRALGTEASMFLSATACYYIANEGLSMLENAQALGVPIPEALRGALENVRRKGEK
ncbi:MAG: phage holin family protein [Clostridiales bacterium]|nr:phage holin family protein [Clostridiales bacterium]